MLLAPLFDGLLVDNSLVPQRVDGLLSLLREVVGKQVLELVQLRLLIDVIQGVQQFQLCHL